MAFWTLLIFRIGYLGVIFYFNFQTFSVRSQIVRTQGKWSNHKNILFIFSSSTLIYGEGYMSCRIPPLLHALFCYRKYFNHKSLKFFILIYIIWCSVYLVLLMLVSCVSHFSKTTITFFSRAKSLVMEFCLPNFGPRK